MLEGEAPGCRAASQSALRPRGAGHSAVRSAKWAGSRAEPCLSVTGTTRFWAQEIWEGPGSSRPWRKSLATPRGLRVTSCNPPVRRRSFFAFLLLRFPQLRCLRLSREAGLLLRSLCRPGSSEGTLCLFELPELLH